MSEVYKSAPPVPASKHFPLQSCGCTIAAWLHALVLWSARMGVGLAAERRRRRAIRELQQFDDNTLADIGISRGEIEYAVRHGRPTPVTLKLNRRQPCRHEEQLAA